MLKEIATIFLTALIYEVVGRSADHLLGPRRAQLPKQEGPDEFVEWNDPGEGGLETADQVRRRKCSYCEKPGLQPRLCISRQCPAGAHCKHLHWYCSCGYARASQLEPKVVSPP